MMKIFSNIELIEKYEPQNVLNDIKEHFPEMPKEKSVRYVQEFGISESDSSIISNSKNPNVPSAHATPTKTTKTEIKVALIDLKNIKKINVVTNRAVKTKSPISSSIF